MNDFVLNTGSSKPSYRKPKAGGNQAVVVGGVAVLLLAVGLGGYFLGGGRVPSFFEPTLDATSTEKAFASIKVMRDSLPDDEATMLAHAVMVKTLPTVMAQGMAGNKKPDVAPALKEWHGWTAQQIIAKTKVAANEARKKK